MKKIVIHCIFILCIVSSPLYAASEDNGETWRKATSSSKLEEIQRILGNIEHNGCKVMYSASYYVRQLDDFYSTAATRGIELSEAIGLIATGAGEVWDC